MFRSKNNPDIFIYSQITRANGIVEDKKLLSYRINNPIKHLLFKLKLVLNK
jgi:hypothetical protein